MKRIVVLAGSAVLACVGLASGMAVTATATPEAAPASAYSASSQPSFGETKRSALQVLDRVIQSGTVCDPKAQRALVKLRKDVKHAKNYKQINAAAEKAAPIMKQYQKNPDCR